MRIKINLNLKGEIVPIRNQDIVNSFIHRVLGKDNKYHDSKNEYSISSLQGGKLHNDKKNLFFNNDGYIIVSSINESFINDIMLKLYTTNFYKNIKVNGIEFIDENLIDGWNHFSTLSPFIIKKYTDKNNYKYLTLKDVDFISDVRTYLVNKISKINPSLDTSNLDIVINNNTSHKVKKIMVKNVVNYANQCQVSIFCTRSVANLIYNIGLGQSTGSGFGTIYKTENHNIYRK